MPRYHTGQGFKSCLGDEQSSVEVVCARFRVQCIQYWSKGLQHLHTCSLCAAFVGTAWTLQVWWVQLHACDIHQSGSYKHLPIISPIRWRKKPLLFIYINTFVCILQNKKPLTNLYSKHATLNFHNKANVHW